VAVRARALLAVMAAALLLAGCPDDDEDQSTTTSSTSAVVTTLPVTTTAAGVSTTAAPAVTTTAPAAATIVLRVDGLSLVDFGDPKDAALSALSAVLGPVDETGTGCELNGADTTTARWKELRVEFADGVVRSYNVRPPNGVAPVLGLKTEAGVGLGSTVAQLETAYGDRLKIPGLPPEFGGNDFSVSFPGTDRVILGSLSGTTDAGTVTGIFTQVCE